MSVVDARTRSTRKVDSAKLRSSMEACATEMCATVADLRLQSTTVVSTDIVDYHMRPGGFYHKYRPLGAVTGPSYSSTVHVRQQGAVTCAGVAVIAVPDR